MKKIGAAILWEHGKILICKRGPGGECQYLWEFPGGKQEPGETIENCAIRECQEELNVNIKLLGVYYKTSYAYANGELDFTFFQAEILSGELRANVHEEIQWVKPEELDQFTFCPADIALVELLKKQDKSLHE